MATGHRTAARPARPPRQPQPTAWTVALASPTETHALGNRIGQLLTGGETLALCGDLGAGKTALVRGIATGLGAPPETVTSPTFVLVQEYHGRLPLLHADLYRLRSRAEAESIGLHEFWQGNGVAAIEWADKFPTELPVDRLDITLEHTGRTTRKARLLAHGPQASQLLTALRRAHRAASTASTGRTARRRPASRRKRRP